jgi:hypothetical protein
MSFIEFYLECVLQKFVCVNIILVLISSLEPILYVKLKLHLSVSKIQKKIATIEVSITVTNFEFLVRIFQDGLYLIPLHAARRN